MSLTTPSRRGAAALLRPVQPVWGGQGRGTSWLALWLALGIGSTFLLGLVLQLLALRTLSGGGYATFVLALGVGNVANALAVVVQPVVAARTAGGDSSLLPVRPTAALAAAATLTLGGAAALSTVTEPVIALFIVLQIPVHAAVGIGLGRLQARRAFGLIAASLGFWAAARVLIALAAMAGPPAATSALVFALPGAQLAQLALLWWLGAYREVRWARAADGSELLRRYALWAVFAWLLNADALYGHARLGPEVADSYAVALTLGRQALYAAAPLAIVLLPVTQAAPAAE